jgi:hypothetical protein
MLTVPGVHPPPPGLDSLLGDDEDEAHGPEWCVDLGDEMRAMNKFELWLALGTGDFSPTTLVWRIGRERWQPARDIPELACALKVHAQTLMMAARAAEQAAEQRTPSDAPDRTSRESLPRVLTPENSVLVAQLSDAETPEQPETDVATALSDRAPASVTPIGRARQRRTKHGRPIARFATALAAVAGTLVFLMSRGDAARMTASIAPPATETAATAPADPTPEPIVVVENPPSQAVGQVPQVDASSAVEDMDPTEAKPKKKASTRKRVKDGVAGSVAGVEADRRGRARQRRTR